MIRRIAYSHSRIAREQTQESRYFRAKGAKPDSIESAR
jgi:hypothetical protein